MSSFIRPPALNQGDNIAIIRPGNGPGKTEFPEFYELGLERLRNVFGLEPIEYPTCDCNMDYLTKHPEDRAEDVMAAFRNDDITGVIATIGGRGEQIRILKYIDEETIRENPTRFYGISDNTSLALYLWNQRIISFYGGQLMTDLAQPGEIDEYALNYLERAFFTKNIGEIAPATTFTDQDLEWGNPENTDRYQERELNPGWRWYNVDGQVIEGRVWGGCLEIVETWLQADKYMPEPRQLDGTVLALETSEEMPDHSFVDRFMMCLGERGLLQRFSAIIVGRAKARSHTKEPPADERQAYRKDQMETMMNRIEEYAPGTPSVFNLDFGHTSPTVPIPIGGKVSIDTEEEIIAFS